jgi:hypothetical protein
MKPMVRPWASVRWMQSRPMGPTGAAIDSPMTRALRKRAKSMCVQGRKIRIELSRASALKRMAKLRQIDPFA